MADEERMDALENQLKEARFLAEEADKKYDEVREPTTDKRDGFSDNNHDKNNDDNNNNDDDDDDGS